MDAERFMRDRRGWLLGVFAALAVVGLGFATAMPVPTGRTALVMRFGQPVRVFDGGQPGLALRIPLVEQAILVDRRLQTLAADGIGVTTRDGQRFTVDGFATWQVRDPLRFYQALGTPDQARGSMQAMLASVLQQHFGRVAAGDLQDQDLTSLRTAFDRELAGYGAAVTDLRLARIALPDGAPLDAAYARTNARAQAEAAAIATEGHSNAQLIRADAEARAEQIYGASFGKDPQFYDFYRAMQSYEATFAQKGSHATIVLSPDNAYLRQFRGK